MPQVLQGNKASKGVVRGTAIVIASTEELSLWKFTKENNSIDDAIVVTRMTDPNYLPIMVDAAGIVTEIGGRTCHAAIVARELGTPAVINLPDAMRLLDGKEISIDGSTGEVTIHDA